MVIDETAIYKSEHDLITDIYDWLNNTSKNDSDKVSYILGAHDMAAMLLSKLKETEKE